VIAIISSTTRERAAFVALCEGRRWVCVECDSVGAFRKLLRHTRIDIVLTRHRLSDGYADDVIAALLEANVLKTTKIVVLFASGVVPSVEARLVRLGTDCILHDPVRVEVLIEYLAKYRRAPADTRTPVRKTNAPQTLEFAGGTVHLVDRQWRCGKRSTKLTPREISLIETLLHSEGNAVTYHNLFSDILGRRFRSDTSNLRVLLGLLDTSARKIGIDLRSWVEVIPKLGYRYRHPPAPAKSRREKPRRSLPVAA
jgi:DNA-binding response OmpR family regulator